MGGFDTHVAANRVVGNVPEIPAWGSVSIDEITAAYHRQHDFFDTAERVAIGLPHDGCSFNDDDLEGLRERLVLLVATGYRVPKSALDAIDAEIAAGKP